MIKTKFWVIEVKSKSEIFRVWNFCVKKLKKNIEKTSFIKRKVKFQRFSAEVLDNNCKTLTGVQTFKSLIDAVNWGSQYFKNKKLRILIKNINFKNKQNFPNLSVKFDDDSSSFLDIYWLLDFFKNFSDEAFLSEEIEDTINIDNNDSLFFYDHKDWVKKDIVGKMYNKCVFKREIEKYIAFNKKYSKKLDQEIIKLSQKSRLRYKGATKFYGKKRNKEMWLGYLQNLIGVKVNFINESPEYYESNNEFLFPLFFIEQPLHRNDQVIKMIFKSKEKNEYIDIFYDPKIIHEIKTPRAMEISDLEKWRDEIDYKVKTIADEIISVKKSYSDNDIDKYIFKNKELVKPVPLYDRIKNIEKFKIFAENSIDALIREKNKEEMH